MTTMTVTDALAELTLLEKRINSARVALDNNTLIAVVEVGKVPTGFKSRDDHAAQARASLQRVDALIDRRRVIKRAIVLSNASTMVTVASQEMTVAEANRNEELHLVLQRGACHDYLSLLSHLPGVQDCPSAGEGATG
jgi:hypothetical protein